MANLRFLQNVLHNGIIFKGPQPAKTNDAGQVVVPAKPGMVVNLETDARGLASIADSLIDRGMAEKTNDPATHTSNLVNGAQEAVSLGTTGTAPTADAVKAQQDAFKQRMAGQQPVTQDQLKQQSPAAPPQPAQAPADKNAQPTPEEVAATAAAAA